MEARMRDPVGIALLHGTPADPGVDLGSSVEADPFGPFVVQTGNGSA
jgi:hypothetical protein